MPEQDPTVLPVRVFSEHASVYDSAQKPEGALALFKEKAIKILNETYGRQRLLDFFDFRVDSTGQLFAFGYYDEEDVPPEGKVGEPVPPEMLKQQNAALAGTALAGLVDHETLEEELDDEFDEDEELGEPEEEETPPPEPVVEMPSVETLDGLGDENIDPLDEGDDLDETDVLKNTEAEPPVTENNAPLEDNANVDSLVGTDNPSPESGAGSDPAA